MIPPAHQKLIQITVTHKCPFNCCHCSQLVPHQPKPFVMSLAEVENALQSLVDYPGHIGIFGGEPLLHPQFDEICRLMQKYVPVKARRELWTMGANWGKYKDIIEDTFYKELIAYNEHEEEQPCWHQPVQIAIEEVITHPLRMWDIIENCWVQLRWSSAITPMGAYFCEVASARAMMMGRPEGIPVEKGWWKRPLSHFEYQMDLCKKCSACLPMPMKANSNQGWDDISPQNFKIMGKSKRPCKIYDIKSLREYYKNHIFEPQTEYLLRGGFKDFPDWTPWRYRPLSEKKHCPEDVKKCK